LYGARTGDYDFSIVLLMHPLNLDGVTIAAAVLPTENAAIPEGLKVMTSGWGSTQNANESDQFLRAVEITSLNQLACAKAFRPQGIRISGQMVCASDKGKDSCFVRTVFISKFFMRR
jgi:hypothetical protein